MATPRELTMRNRAQQLLIRKAVTRDVRKLWPLLKWDNLDESYPGLAAPMAVLVKRHRQDSAALTAAYMRAHRLASGVRSRDFRPVIAGPVDPEQFAVSLRVMSVVALKDAAARGVVSDLAMANALTLTEGAMSRLALDGGRDTMMETVQADDAATAWYRVVGGKGCDFCWMLADRGAVYSKDTYDFASHNNCGCTGEPLYGSRLQHRVGSFHRKTRDREEGEDVRGPRQSTEKSRARLRSYLAANPHA